MNTLNLTKKLMTRNLFTSLAGLLCFSPALLLAAETNGSHGMDLTGNAIGYVSLASFGLAYLLVTAEEFTRLRKSN